MNDALPAAAAALGWLLAFAVLNLTLAYRRVSLRWASIALTALLLAYWLFGSGAAWWKALVSIPVAVLLLLNVRPLRSGLITRPFLKSYRRLLPPMSATEREALDAGTVWWDGELFSGGPNWQKLMSAKAPVLTAAEQAFLDGPCETLCAMLDDWDITHRRGDMPPQVWAFIKSQGFFAMIIPKRYGGLEFSAYAHSCVLVKIASRCATASSTIAVPNSLGPAELLLHYGTEEQKNHYLPRLARGEEVPCFALTGPRAGSDAAAIPDTGIIRRGEWRGAQVLGIQLNFSKRYITLAPVATVIGLAFRLFDPDRLMGERTDLGITCALIPRDTPGISNRAAALSPEHSVSKRPDPGQGRIRSHRFDHRRLRHGRPGLAHVGRTAVGGALHFAAVEYHRRGEGGRVRLRRLCASSPTVQHADRPLRGHRTGARADGGAHLHHRCRPLGHGRSDRRWRKALGSVRHAQVSRDRARPNDRERRDGRSRRQGDLSRPQELPGARLSGRARRHHRRGREYPDAQLDHLRAGRRALSSLGAARNERRPQSEPRARRCGNSTTPSWAMWVLRSPTRSAR